MIVAVPLACAPCSDFSRPGGTGVAYNGVMDDAILRPTDHGLYCETGDFFVDPWRPVDRAIVTHAHADHACRGCGRYLTARDGENVLRARMNADAVIESAGYGETVHVNGVTVSLHPAGHILGSSQVRVEH